MTDELPFFDQKREVDALVEKANQTYERDERWEDMYACVVPYTVDFEDLQLEVVKIGMYVWYKGGFYWSEQKT